MEKIILMISTVINAALNLIRLKKETKEQSKKVRKD